MKSLDFSKKNLPTRDEYDVVIAGGGTAGAVAAISCGMEGLRTLVVEPFGCLGGTQTNGLVTPLMASYIPGDRLSSSIDMELRARGVSRLNLPEAGGEAARRFDPTALSSLLEEMVFEHEVDIAYDTTVIDAVREGNRVEALVLHNSDGLSAVSAPYFIDATGDADVAHAAGIPCDSGDKDGWNQSVTLRFEMSGVDLERFGDWLEGTGQKMMTRYPNLHWELNWSAGSPALKQLVQEQCAIGLLTRQDLSHLQLFAVAGRPGTINFNSPELGRDRHVASAAFQGRKRVEGRKAIARLANFLRREVPGFEEASVSLVAPMLGVRESRRVRARYVLTRADLLAYRKFPDGIAMSNYPVDVHGPSSEKEPLAYADVPLPEKYWEIPYRCLVPVEVENLLVVGRCAGFDFVAQSAARVQHSCRAMGEAAGIAVHLARGKRSGLPEVDGSLVRDAMRRRGAPL